MPPRVIDGQVMDGVGNGYVPSDELEIDPGLRIWDGERPEVDPITYEVLRHNLWNINEEHGSAIIKVSGSPIASVGRDFNPCIMDPLGDFIFFGPYLQFHAGMQDLTVKWILENRSGGAGIADGDMFLHNDPWVGTSHQQDVATMCPIFWEGELFCWVGSTLHFPDLGGPKPGGWCPDATSVFDEPLPTPPVKIVEGGELRDDVEQMWVRRSRIPASVALDTRAVIAGNTVARERILRLVRRYGPGTVKAVMERIVDDAEAAFLTKIATVPDGTWSAQAFAEIAGPGDRHAYRGFLTVTKEGDTLTFSNRGTDPQVGALGATYAGWRGGILSVINPLLCYDSLFAIGGALRHVRFEPEPGTFTCATYPASVSNAGGVGVLLSLGMANDAVAKLMACSDSLRPELSCVTGSSVYPVSSLSGTNQWGEYFSFMLLDFFDASMGAQPWRDGIHTSGTFWGPLQVAPNVEDSEQTTPILYLRREELVDSAAPGKYTGGAGSIAAYVAHGTEVIQHQFSAAGVAVPTSVGSFGGQPGIPNGFRYKRETDIRSEWFECGRVPAEFDDVSGEAYVVKPQDADFEQRPDDVYELWCCSGGGWGDPLDRDPEAVARDVREGYCSPAAAERVYETVLGADGEPDLEATARQRAEARARRLGKQVGELREERDEGASESRLGTVGEYLAVVADGDGGAGFECRKCGTDLGPAHENYKERAVVRDRDIAELGRYFHDPSYFIDDPVCARDHFCPGCGTLLQVDIARRSDPLLVDVTLTPAAS